MNKNIILPLFTIVLVIISCTGENNEHGSDNPAVKNEKILIDEKQDDNYTITQHDLDVIVKNNNDVVHIIDGKETVLGHIEYEFRPDNKIEEIANNGAHYYIITSYGGSVEDSLILMRKKGQLLGCGNIPGIFKFYNGYFLGQAIVSGPVVTFDHFSYRCYTIQDDKITKTRMPVELIDSFVVDNKMDFYSLFGLLFSNRKDLITKEWVDNNMPQEYIKDIGYEEYKLQYNRYLSENTSLSFFDEDSKYLIFNKWYFYKMMEW